MVFVAFNPLLDRSEKLGGFFPSEICWDLPNCVCKNVYMAYMLYDKIIFSESIWLVLALGNVTCVHNEIREVDQLFPICDNESDEQNQRFIHLSNQ